MGDSIMRTLNVVFEDMEHAALEELKIKVERIGMIF